MVVADSKFGDNTSIVLLIKAVFLLSTNQLTVIAFPGGAPTGSCSNLRPGHGSQQADQSPARLLIKNDIENVTTWRKIEVIIEGEYNGILLMARRIGENDVMYGSFEPSQDLRTLECPGGRALTHRQVRILRTSTVTWWAPNDASGQVYFIATVSMGQDKYWFDVHSISIPFTTTTLPTTTTATTITSNCRMSFDTMGHKNDAVNIQNCSTQFDVNQVKVPRDRKTTLYNVAAIVLSIAVALGLSALLKLIIYFCFHRNPHE